MFHVFLSSLEKRQYVVVWPSGLNHRIYNEYSAMWRDGREEYNSKHTSRRRCRRIRHNMMELAKPIRNRNDALTAEPIRDLQEKSIG